MRVANEIGKGDSKAAIFSIKVILCTSLGLGVIFSILCLAFGKKISYLFTSDEEVAEAVSSISTLLSLSILLNSIQPVLTGEFRQQYHLLLYTYIAELFINVANL